jgi:hypothetical protein
VNPKCGDSGLQSWLSATDECVWLGVSCNENGLVTRIDFRKFLFICTLLIFFCIYSALTFECSPYSVEDADQFADPVSLTGRLPEEIKLLVELEDFVAPDHAVAGSITTCFEGLTNLKVINLEENRMTGTISPTIGTDFPNLISFELGYNQIKGPIPVSFSEIASLESLGIGHNQLTGSIPPELGLIPGLRKYSSPESMSGTTVFPLYSHLVSSSNRISGAGK